MQSEFAEFGFNFYVFTKEVKNIADCFGENNRCGIYILHFETGEYYVGLATDVVRRYGNHRLIHKDIEYVSFKQFDAAKLRDAEKDVIYTLERLQKRLRNISLASIVVGETDLDLVISPEQQSQWIANHLSNTDFPKVRFDYPELRAKYRRKYEQLKIQKEYPLIVEVLNKYILTAIPFPYQTEYSFWNCSCLPAAKGKVFTRVSIFWHEVLTIVEVEFIEEENPKSVLKEVIASLHLGKSAFLKGRTEAQLLEIFPSLVITDHFYEPGGQDQLNIYIDFIDFFRLLEDPISLAAVKEFNLRLMRKGGCVSKRYHCLDLADAALRDINMPDS